MLSVLKPEYVVVDELEAIPARLRGVHVANPVNLAKSGGVQLEQGHLHR